MEGQVHLYTGKISAVGEKSDELIETIYDFIKNASEHEKFGITAKHLFALSEMIEELAQRKKEIENDLGE